MNSHHFKILFILNIILFFFSLPCHACWDDDDDDWYSYETFWDYDSWDPFDAWCITGFDYDWETGVMEEYWDCYLPDLIIIADAPDTSDDDDEWADWNDDDEWVDWNDDDEWVDDTYENSSFDVEDDEYSFIDDWINSTSNSQTFNSQTSNSQTNSSSFEQILYGPFKVSHNPTPISDIIFQENVNKKNSNANNSNYEEIGKQAVEKIQNDLKNKNYNTYVASIKSASQIEKIGYFTKPLLAESTTDAVIGWLDKMKISSLAKNPFYECFGKSMSFLGVGLGASETAVILIEKETLSKGDWLTITGNAFCAVGAFCDVLGLTLDVSGVGIPVGLTLNTIGVVCGLVSWYIGSEIIVPLENGYYLCLTQV